MKLRALSLFLILSLVMGDLMKNEHFASAMLDDSSFYTSLSEQSAEQKVGQILMLPICGFDEETERFAREKKIAGFLLLDEAVASGAYLSELTNKITAAAAGYSSLPPFIAAAESVILSDSVTDFPAAMAFAAAGNHVRTYIQGTYLGLELASLGINMYFSSMFSGLFADESTYPLPASQLYSDSAETVGLYSVGLMQGLWQNGVLPVGKSFPALSATGRGENFFYNTQGSAELAEGDLAPFINAFENGLPAVSVGDAVFSGIDPAVLPACLSGRLVSGFLKEELGFNGIVVADRLYTDDMRSLYSPEEAAVAALKAGCNLIVLPEDLEEAARVYNALLEAVKSGEITAARLDFSVYACAKQKRAVTQDIAYGKPLSAAALEVHRNFAASVAEASITVLSDGGGLLYDSALKTLVISAPAPYDQGTSFAKEAAEAFGYDYLVLPEVIEDIAPLLEIASHHERVIMAISEGVDASLQFELAQRLLNIREKTVVISFDTPYAHRYLIGCDAAVNAYEYTEHTVASVIKILQRESVPKGISPIK